MNARPSDRLRIIYILCLVGAFVGITMIVGVVLSYIEKGRWNDDLFERHVRNQIRIFWGWFTVVAFLVAATILSAQYWNGLFRKILHTN